MSTRAVGQLNDHCCRLRLCSCITRPLAVSVLALGIVATVASVASAGTVGESVQTTAQLAAAAKTPEARPAKPVVQAPKVTTFAEVGDAGGFGVAVVGACDVVRHKIDDRLQPLRMGALEEGFKFGQTLFGIVGQGGGDVVIVFDGVGRAEAAFDDIGIIGGDACPGKCRCGCMLEHARVPYMGDAEILERDERGIGDAVEFADTVFLKGAPRFAGGIGIAEMPDHQLINNRFHGSSFHSVLCCILVEVA